MSGSLCFGPTRSKFFENFVGVRPRAMARIVAHALAVILRGGTQKSAHGHPSSENVLEVGSQKLNFEIAPRLLQFSMVIVCNQRYPHPGT